MSLLKSVHVVVVGLAQTGIGTSYLLRFVFCVVFVGFHLPQTINNPRYQYRWFVIFVFFIIVLVVVIFDNHTLNPHK